MAITLVQATSGSHGTGSTTLTLTFTNPVTAGNMIIVCWQSCSTGTNPTLSGITIGGSADNFAVVKTETNSNAGNVAIWADPNCAGGGTSLVITQSGTGGGQSAFAYEVSGLATSAATDKTAGGTGSSGAWSSGATATTTNANEFWVGMCSSTDGSTMAGPASPWTNETAITQTVSILTVRSVSGYQIASSTGAATYSGTSSGNDGWGAAVATFLPSSGSGANVTGVAAAVTVAGGIGSLEADLNLSGTGGAVTVAGGVGSPAGAVAVTGVAAAIEVDGGIGTATGSGDVNVTGVGAAVTVAGGVGSYASDQNLTGTGAQVTVAAGAGIPAGGGNANVSGAGAQVAVAGGVGSFKASAAATGVGAQLTLAGGVGSSSASANVTGVGAAVTVAGGHGSFAISTHITGVAAQVSVTGGVGRTSRQLVVTMAARSGVDDYGNPYPLGFGASAGAMPGTIVNTGSLPASAIVANSITASQIAAGTITATQIAAGTITATQIAAGTITATQLQAGIVVAGIVDSTTINTATLTAAVISGGNISGTTITGGTISGGMISGATINGATITAGGSFGGGFEVQDSFGNVIGQWSESTGLQVTSIGIGGALGAAALEVTGGAHMSGNCEVDGVMITNGATWPQSTVTPISGSTPGTYTPSFETSLASAINGIISRLVTVGIIV